MPQKHLHPPTHFVTLSNLKQRCKANNQKNRWNNDRTNIMNNLWRDTLTSHSEIYTDPPVRSIKHWSVTTAHCCIHDHFRAVVQRMTDTIRNTTLTGSCEHELPSTFCSCVHAAHHTASWPCMTVCMCVLGVCVVLWTAYQVLNWSAIQHSHIFIGSRSEFKH